MVQRLPYMYRAVPAALSYFARGFRMAPNARWFEHPWEAELYLLNLDEHCGLVQRFPRPSSKPYCPDAVYRVRE